MANLFGKNWYTDPTGIPARCGDVVDREALDPTLGEQLARRGEDRVEPHAPARLDGAVADLQVRGRRCRSAITRATGEAGRAGSRPAAGWPPLSWRNWSQIW